MPPEATVLVPTHDHGPTLLRSVPTALRQTVEDLEVFIVGDGVPQEARDIIEDLRRTDPRIRFFDYPKGAHRGEAHRHRALEEARGEIVCYLTDDDLWLPEHVEVMRDLLRDADFAHTLTVHALPDGSLGGWNGDLALPFFRRLLLDGTNYIPFPCGAHTLAAYRRTPGWRPDPRTPYTDLTMWQRILSLPDVRAVTGTLPTVVYFHERGDRPIDERLEELDRWVHVLDDPAARARLQAEALDLVFRDRAHLLAALLESVRTESTPETVFSTYQMTRDPGLRARRERSLEELPASFRGPLEERVAALEENLALLRREREELRSRLDLVTGSRTWKIRERLMWIPGLSRLVRR